MNHGYLKKLFVGLMPILILFLTSNIGYAKDMSVINTDQRNAVKAELIKKYGESNKERINTGVDQSAFFWYAEDGSFNDFQQFCIENFIADENKLKETFLRISEFYESLNGNFNRISLDLKRPIHLEIGEILPIDYMFGSYEPAAHLADDFFKNKIAFYILLNFKYSNLDEKTTVGLSWDRYHWALARLGDVFTSRVPSDIAQKYSEAVTNADNYISAYNIFMGKLVDNKFNTYFPPDLKLLAHWNLRDELKSQYAKKDGLVHQKMIYDVMNHIVLQDIPSEVINKADYEWNPVTNKLYKDKKEVKFTPEPDTRYEYLLNNFKAVREEDSYSPFNPTYIDRKFNVEMEIPQNTVEDLFIKFCSSQTVRKEAKLISKRLGRKLEPFDIWYDGFKSRAAISEDELNKMTRAKYPNPQAFKNDIPRILKNIGFTEQQADFIASKIDVDPARGSGHAWGSQTKSDHAHLRTRIAENGMDYKGYNIAVHELGHNVEQTLTLQNVDYYMMMGVPNTAFTEAWAFVFQKRDLELLGIKDDNPDNEHLMALDNCWSAYEIMGVALVDMEVWKWLYNNPNANKTELKNQTIKIAKEIWNKYYADVFGVKDQVILAVYSHMINDPLYLPAYPIGHMVEFQMEQQMRGKNIAQEMYRMYTPGRLTPKSWMLNAVGNELSIEPTLQATEEALKAIK